VMQHRRPERVLSAHFGLDLINGKASWSQRHTRSRDFTARNAASERLVYSSSIPWWVAEPLGIGDGR
jgi:hypothetical protein